MYHVISYDLLALILIIFLYLKSFRWLRVSYINGRRWALYIAILLVTLSGLPFIMVTNGIFQQTFSNLVSSGFIAAIAISQMGKLGKRK